MVKKTSKKKKNARESKEVCEVFEVGDEGNEKIVRACDFVDSRPPTKKEIDYENKLLRNMLIIFGLFVLILVIGYIIVSSARHFEYKGVKFDVVKEGKIIFYRTTIPAMYQGNVVDYYFFIRNDPRKLDTEVPFEGEQNLLKNMVINLTEDFNCEGDGVIAIANFLKFYEFIGTSVIKDENASCDPEGKYMFVQIQKGNSTEILKTGPACYDINIANCEILKGTERFMVKTFVDIQDMI